MIHSLPMHKYEFMKKYLLIKTIVAYLLFTINVVAAQQSYFEEGIILFDKKEFNKSKKLFEKDIVFNPKSEKSYLYLAKIFNKNDNNQEEEINLNNVLLLNPLNDEAVYMLTLLKIKQSDYKGAKELIERFFLVCKSFCFKKAEIQEMLDKLTPENEKSNN